MASLEPFRGVRYDPSLVRMDQVIAPPYDVVGSSERTLLANRSPINAVHLELPQPDLAGGRDPYQVAAQLLDSWLERKVLIPDPRPALYPYRMTNPDGRASLGVIGALGIGGDVMPHEQTLPKPKSDRLDLLRATRANLSPIWGLSLTRGLTATFEPKGLPVADAYDDQGVRHQLWVLDDPAAVGEVVAAVAESGVVIADGHHRYETSRLYRDELASGPDVDDGRNAVMALIVELAEDQLQVGAIHRLVEGLPEGTDIPALFGRWFDTLRAGGATERVAGALADANTLSLLTPDGAWLLTPRADRLEEAGTDLDSGFVDLVLAEAPGAELSYCYTWRDVLGAVRDASAQAAVLLRPVTVAQIAEWARADRRMPPKTTYFTPKPRTGMVFRLLGG